MFACEDIGRHNAFDKVIGYALRNQIDLRQCIVYSSGRIPVDMADPGGDSGSGGQGGADLRGSAAGGGVRTYAGVLGKAGYDEGVCLLNRVKRS